MELLKKIQKRSVQFDPEGSGYDEEGARKAPYLFHAADRVNDVLVDDFMGGYDIGIPTFVSHVYEACRKVIPVEVFRNNWREITDRITGRSR